MSGIFDFIFDVNTYEQRKIGRYEDEITGRMVSTCTVSDSDYPYETAIKHPSYNDGKLIVVQNYSTKEAAKTGHEKWVDKLKSDDLPHILEDVSQAGIKKLCDAFAPESERNWARYERKR